MSQLAIGMIETVGLAAGIEAADVCVKSANVTLIGYELTKGNGMTVVKIEGNVGAVKAAIEAATVAASKISSVFSTKVIPRPSNSIDFLMRNSNTVGYEKETINKKEEIIPDHTFFKQVPLTEYKNEKYEESYIKLYGKEENEPHKEIDKQEEIPTIAEPQVKKPRIITDELGITKLPSPEHLQKDCEKLHTIKTTAEKELQKLQQEKRTIEILEANMSSLLNDEKAFPPMKPDISL